MTGPEDRVGALETRVDELEVDVRHATDVGSEARRIALGAEAAHQRNIELLNALRVTQAEHRRMHTEHSRRFDTIDSKLGQLTVGMHAIESMLQTLIERD